MGGVWSRAYAITDRVVTESPCDVELNVGAAEESISTVCSRTCSRLEHPRLGAWLERHECLMETGSLWL